MVETDDKKLQLQQCLHVIASEGTIKNKTLSSTLVIIDALLRTEEGISYLYDHIEEIVSTGLFEGTSWEYPDKLVPSLVEGTLCSGFPMVIYESLSELRILKLALGEWTSDEFSQEEARFFLQKTIIACFKLVFQGVDEEGRGKMSLNRRKRIRLLFDFLLSRMPLESLKVRLATELKAFSDQRPIMTDKLQEILGLVKSNMQLDTQAKSDQLLSFFIDALFHPTPLTKKCERTADYQVLLNTMEPAELIDEAHMMSSKMNQTGLVSEHHVLLLNTLNSRHPDLIVEALSLNAHGKAEAERHLEFVREIIKKYVVPGHEEVVYGLSKLLNRNLLSRKAVYNALKKLFVIRLHPEAKRRLLKRQSGEKELTAEQLLGGGILRLLGQPLGVGQGLNPTCQSARGLSMWSRHSPGKLLNMVIMAAASNELTFRFQGELVSSAGLIVVQSFDFNLDPVSTVLVPHLDYIYQQMMQKAQLRYPGEDPHVTVNPEFYGQWIQTGFISCYNPLLNVIQNYSRFVKLFYAAFHPAYNGGFRMIYPVPLGVFITTSHAEFLGFHAVSLLRVSKTDSGEWRAYFFNPNNEGRQNWGQDITPTVSGHGENHGESSLPFYQFVSRVYAFHYNSFEAESNIEQVDHKEELEQIERLARDSWGKKYFWE